jgi:integrase
MNRRGNGEGEIRLRPDGRWEARLRLGDGKRKSIFGKTRKEVQIKLDELKHNFNRGLPMQTDERQTLGEYLDDWIAKRKAEVDRGLITYGYWRRLEESTRKYIKPTLGRIALTKLTIQQVEQLYAQVLTTKAPKTVAKIQITLRKALNDALRQELVMRNVAALAELEQGKRRVMSTYTAEESARIREAARGHKYEAAIVLFTTTACRLGEILGLRWEALDLERGTMQIVTTLKETEKHRWVLGTPKTESSRRCWATMKTTDGDN